MNASKPRRNSRHGAKLASWWPLLSQREASIGVSVNETNSESSVAEAITRPNWRKKPPTVPDMNATGVNTTTSTRVIAMAAIPISLRPLMAASCGSSPISRWRKMFSSTTMRVVHQHADHHHQRHRRHQVQGEPEEEHHQEGRDQRGGDREQHDHRAAQGVQEDQQHQAGQDDGLEQAALDAASASCGSTPSCREMTEIWTSLGSSLFSRSISALHARRRWRSRCCRTAW